MIEYKFQKLQVYQMALTYAEQHRFLGHTLRSYLETIACFDLIERRKYLPKDEIIPLRASGHELFIKLQAFRKSIKPS
jgi:hypothetical protein